ncbi:MAG TPA: alpha/beta fold hydrolase [Thermoanaerobaculia bacterium]
MLAAPLIILIAVMSATPAFAIDGAPALLWGQLEAGPYAVGYRTMYERDAMRPWSGGRGRPIRIALWYPAAPGAASDTMRYVDYLHYDGPEDFHDIDEPLDANDRQSWIKDLTDVAPNGGEIAARLFATRTAAHRDAAPAAGRFPLLLYCAGAGGRGDSNAELGEYLASHGYIVMTVSNIGASPANFEMENGAADLEAHTRDMERAWNQMRHLPYVDASRVATAGHSVGGIVALYLGMRHPDVKAVISLDGSFGFAGHVDSITRLDGYAPSRVSAALLDLRRANHLQEATHDRTVVRALRHSDRYLISFPRMFHGDFTEFAPVAFVMSVPMPPNTDGRTRRTAYDGNLHAYRAALDFLDWKVRGDRNGWPRLTAEVARANGAVLEHLRH